MTNIVYIMENICYRKGESKVQGECAMRWFKHEQTDERIDQLKNKIYKEAHYLVLAICIVSLMVKMIVQGPNGISPIWTELVIVTVSSLYYVARSAKLGLYSDEIEVHDRGSKLPMTAKNALIGGLIGLGIALFFGVRSAVLYADGGLQSVWYFLIVSLASLIIYVPVYVGIMLILHAVAFRTSKRASQLPED